MLSIRDEEVRTLAETVMRISGAPNLTAAIKLALQREIKRAEEALPWSSAWRRSAPRPWRKPTARPRHP